MKVVFIVTTKEEFESMLPLCEEILRRNKDDVLIIHTGILCCDKDGTPPMEALGKSVIPFHSLLSYGTKNIVRILEQEKADTLVVGSDQEYLRRAFVYAAGGLGIPQLLLQVGISSNSDNTIRFVMRRTIYRLTYYFLNIVKKYLYLLRTVIALRWSPYKIVKMLWNDIREALTVWDNRGSYGCHRIAVAGSWERGVLAERGVDMGKVVITGHPLVGRNLFATGNSLRDELGIGGDDKVILLLTSSQVEHGHWSEDKRNEFVNKAIDAVAPLLSNSVHLVIKIHPVESLDVYQGIVNARKEKIILYKDTVLADVINMSDIVLISGYSTTVLQVSVLGKPAVLLNTFNEVQRLPYANMELAIEVNDIRELKAIVESLLYDKESRDECLSGSRLFCDSNREFINGKATDRIVSLIESMI